MAMPASHCVFCALLVAASFAARVQTEDSKRAAADDYSELAANLTALLDFATRMKWSRAEVVSNLCNRYSIGNLQVKCYNREEDGLMWSGSSWYPGKVFRDGFLKTPTPSSVSRKDPGDSVDGWGKSILDSIIGNSWTYGFHFTMNPVVASTFAAQHVGRSVSADDKAEYECDDYWDNDCKKGILRQYQQRYGCPGDGAPVFEEDLNCWQKPCVRLDKLSDPDEGLDELCPNWGYAYLVKAEGIHVRVSTHDAVGKDYSAEEEVFVPIGVKGSQILGAIPIYARSANGMTRTPALINFQQNWKVFKSMHVSGLHTKDGKDASSGIGAFIHNPGYSGGDGPAEVEVELRKKRVAEDLGTAVPKYD
eukprot:TRINITY_DN33712_c0_g1_i1.p1 TRINITY_DN33712_c0_g1~~TRINITY_DN33712_c0_g1_i1.p1  ORF type:complete len:364 (+),score=78.53 TRINITY_DN33712_c0_g1_i1:70-1161(+)